MRLLQIGIFCVLICRCLLPVQANVTAASLFGDNMVLQRGKPVPVWGTATPGERVRVSFDWQSVDTTGTDGKWQAKLAALKADSTPSDLIIAGNNTIRFTNVLVGEVWVCSGQSNMEFSFSGVKNAPQEIAAADYPAIRMFTVTKYPSPLPRESCGGSWEVCTPKAAPGFSAVGYFYARELYKTLHVPIGMIHTSWGGTPAETWTSLPGLHALPLFQQRAADFEKAVSSYQADKEKYTKEIDEANHNYVTRLAAWYKQEDDTDPGMTGKWMDPAFVEKDWKPITFPVDYTSNPLPQWLGTMWCRKQVEIPASWVGKELELHIGAVDEADDTYVNGQHVGRIWFDAPGYWTAPRIYVVPAALVTSTKVSLTVRVLNKAGQLGLFGPEAEMKLLLKGRTDKPVALSGIWHYQFALQFTDMPQDNLPLIPGTTAGELEHAVQRHDRPAHPLCHSRRHLVPGGIQRRRSAGVSPALPGHDCQLAAGLA